MSYMHASSKMTLWRWNSMGEASQITIKPCQFCPMP
jgi:hypothetical protein